MLWFTLILVIPVIVAVLLFISAAEDFWQIITLRIDFGRLFGDLVHVLFILGIGGIAELFALYMLIAHL
ncbi:MAG: hypothetical protein JJ714_07530 [Acidithiobacillus sp.]|nr:hypothetical protein [Acidithiobacillus sp.]